MIRTALVLAALLAGAPSAIAKTIAPGIYGNVRMSDETGDLGGAELELQGSGRDARVAFVLCEGWCNSVIVAPATITEHGFSFSYEEQLVDQDGHPAVTNRYRVEAVATGSGLRITVRQVDGARSEPFTLRLKRLRHPFGLSVAREN